MSGRTIAVHLLSLAATVGCSGTIRLQDGREVLSDKKDAIDAAVAKVAREGMSPWQACQYLREVEVQLGPWREQSRWSQGHSSRVGPSGQLLTSTLDWLHEVMQPYCSGYLPQPPGTVAKTVPIEPQPTGPSAADVEEAAEQRQPQAGAAVRDVDGGDELPKAQGAQTTQGQTPDDAGANGGDRPGVPENAYEREMRAASEANAAQGRTCLDGLEQSLRENKLDIADSQLACAKKMGADEGRVKTCEAALESAHKALKTKALREWRRTSKGLSKDGLTTFIGNYGGDAPAEAQHRWARQQAAEEKLKGSEHHEGRWEEDFWDTHGADGKALDPDMVEFARGTDPKIIEMGRHNCTEAAIGGEIVQRIDPHTYEVVTQGTWGIGQSLEHAILKTTKTVFTGAGDFRVCVKRHRGQKRVTLKNNFSELWKVYTEGAGSL